MSDTLPVSAHERRTNRISLQRQKVAALAPGGHQRAIEEAILGTMVNSAMIGDFADFLSADAQPLPTPSTR